MQSFLHDYCKAGMCQDCIELAEEYQMLEEKRKEAMRRAEAEMDKTRSRCGKLERKAKMWEEIADYAFD